MSDTFPERSGDKANKKEFLNASIGVETLGETFTPILERGLTLPCEKTEVFSTGTDNQSSLEIHVLQGDAKSVSDPSMKHIGRYTLKGIPPGQAGMPQIEVAFVMTSDGQFQLRAKDLITGHTIEVAGEDTDSGISELDITNHPEVILQKSGKSIGETVNSNKAKARQLAVDWWNSDQASQSRARGYAICDSNGRHRIPVGGGYLCNPGGLVMPSVLAEVFASPDLVCESCFDCKSYEPYNAKETDRVISQAKDMEDMLSRSRLPWVPRSNRKWWQFWK